MISPRNEKISTERNKTADIKIFEGKPEKVVITGEGIVTLQGSIF